MPAIPRFMHVCAVFACVLTVSALASAQAANVSGKWVGTFDVVHPDGSVDPDNACFSFTQNGDAISGAAGDSPAHPSPIASAHISGDQITFSVGANSQRTVQFQLTLKGDRLEGSVTGITDEPGASVVVNAVRADDNWHASTMPPHVADSLFDNVAALDKKLFDAYNACDLATLESLVSEDLEFYHDKTGFAVGRKVFIEAIRNNICGKTQRILVPGTLEVHRLSGFGAVEMGVHRFTHPSDPSIGVGEGKFITIWRFKDGQWQMTRAISYDHAPAKN